MSLFQLLRIWWKQQDYVFLEVPKEGVVVAVATARHGDCFTFARQNLRDIDGLEYSWRDIVFEVKRALRKK